MSVWPQPRWQASLTSESACGTVSARHALRDISLSSELPRVVQADRFLSGKRTFLLNMHYF